MATRPRGRGYAIQVTNKGPSSPPLRRPGESGLRQRFGNSFQNDNPVNTVKTEDEVGKLCNQIGKMSLSDPKKEMSSIYVNVMSLCGSCEGLQNFVEKICSFALTSKWNAHAIAVFCESYINISIESLKLRTLLLRTLQGLYVERNKSYLSLEKFFMDVTFICEVFYHVKIDDSCIQVLAHPIIDYLGMLIDGGSQKEVEVFYEQFPKCFKNLKACDPAGLDNLLNKIRKQLVSEATTVTVRATLLVMFEMTLTDWKPLDQNAKSFYDSLSKPIVRICE